MTSIDRTIKPKKGRPEVDSEPVNLRLTRDLLKQIDDYRRTLPEIPTRPEAIRQILKAHFSKG